MNLVPALPAALAALALFLLPGLLFLALLPRRDREDLPFDEALFVGVGAGVVWAAWLGLALAEAGRFWLPTAGALTAALMLLLALALRRRLTWPLPRPDRRSLPALLVLLVALGLDARPSEYLVGGRDPGAYVAAMCLIGRTGGIVVTDPVVTSVPAEDRELFFRNPERPDFSWSRFMGFDLERPETGRVFPQFFHLFPAFGAYLFQALGVRGALATPAVFGVLGTLGVFLAFRRLLGAPVALLGTLLLAGNEVQVWFARYPVSEPVSLFLIFLGLLALSRWEAGSRAFGALCGVAFGLSLLVRIDSLLLVAPLGLYLVVRRACRDLSLGDALALLLPFSAVALHAALHAALFAGKYVADIANRPYWRQPPAAWAGLLAALLAGLLLADRLLPVLLRRAVPHAPRLRRAAAVLLALLALYAYAVRPELSALAGGDGNDTVAASTIEGQVRDGAGEPAAGALVTATVRGTGTDRGAIADAQGQFRIEGLGAGSYDVAAEHRGAGGRVERLGLGRGRTRSITLHLGRSEPAAPDLLQRLGFQRLAAHDAAAFRRLGWFVTPLGLLLGTLGILGLVRDAPLTGSRGLLLPLLTALAFGLFYFYKIRVWSDYYFALRRFVPVVLPFLMIGVALVLVRLWARGGAGRLLALLAGGYLAVSFGTATARIARHVDWQGAVRFVDDVARRFAKGDVVVFEQPRSIHLLSLPLWAAHGANVIELARFNPDPERLAHLVRTWRAAHRNVYFVSTYRTDLCGLFLQRVEEHSFGSFEWERAYAAPPTRREFRSLKFTVSRVVLPEELSVPPLPEVDVGGSDDVLVSGFFDKEGGGPHTFRWSGTCGSVYLPGVQPGGEVVLSVAVDRRPASNPARVRVSLSGAPLGEFLAEGTGFRDYRLPLPDPLPGGPAVLRIDVPGFRPANVDAGSQDTRDLGVMLDRVRIESRPGPS